MDFSMMAWEDALTFQSPLLKNRPLSPRIPSSRSSSVLSASTPIVMEEMVQGNRRSPSTKMSLAPLINDLIPVANPPSLYYRPIIAPISPNDIELLRAMRVASGWYYERIPAWINEIATGQRLMWFIYLSDPLSDPMPPVLATAAESAHSYQSPSSPYGHYINSASGSASSSGSSAAALHSATASTSAVSTGEVHPPVGMVCISLSNPQDPSLASFSLTGRCEICSLFVYAAYRPLGVGAAAMQNMEERARMMGAIFVTLNTPAIERPLRKYMSMGYREYKPRGRVYSSADVRNAGLPEDYETAAFLEKSLT
jgi:ribosomal protein S18 acetylase RimI-like enzyme